MRQTPAIILAILFVAQAALAAPVWAQSGKEYPLPGSARALDNTLRVAPTLEIGDKAAREALLLYAQEPETLFSLYCVVADHELAEARKGKEAGYLCSHLRKKAMARYRKVVDMYRGEQTLEPYFLHSVKRLLAVNADMHGTDFVFRWYADLIREKQRVFNGEALAGVDAVFVGRYGNRLGTLTGQQKVFLYLRAVNVSAGGGFDTPGKSGRPYAMLVKDIRSSPTWSDDLKEYARENAVPHQVVWLELLILVGLFAFILALCFLSYLLTPRQRMGGYGNFSFWKINGDAPEPFAVQSGDSIELLIDNTGSLVPYRVYKLYGRDFLMDKFVMNHRIPGPVLIAVVSLFGFGAISLLSFVEGTLGVPSRDIELPFLQTVADPVNWAVCVPLTFWFIRVFYSYAPRALNLFYENLLQGNAKREVLAVVDALSTNLFFKKRFVNITIYALSFLGAAIGFIQLAQCVELYGFTGNLPQFFAEELYAAGIHRVPTVLGMYVIFALSVLVYAIMFCLRDIVITIFLFKSLYDRFRVRIHINPFHPDKCGGLAFSGNLAFRMILVVAVSGLMGFNLVLRDVFVAGQTALPYHYFMLPLYLLSMPIVFFFPILHARRLLLAEKERYLESLTGYSHFSLADYFPCPGAGNDDGTRNIQGLVKSIKSLQTLLNQNLPTWPINIQPVIGFCTAFLLPILIPIVLERLF